MHYTRSVKTENTGGYTKPTTWCDSDLQAARRSSPVHLVRQLIFKLALYDCRFRQMSPFIGTCAIPEQQMEVGVITVGENRSSHNKAARQEDQPSRQDEDVKNVRLVQATVNKGKRSSDATSSEDDSSQTESGTIHPPLKRLSRGARNNRE